MATPGWDFDSARSGSPMSPSPKGHETAALMIACPAGSVSITLPTMAWNTAGTPAMTKTLSMRKPGATETSLSISVAPSGVRAMRRRAGVNSISRPA